MQNDSRNIYQIARKIAGYTQERSAEMLYLSVESVRDYESGKTIPPNGVVCRMVEIYNAQYLAYQHLIYSSEVARKCLPNFKIEDLQAAMMRLQKEVNDFIKCREELIDITYDGVITSEERPRFDSIIKELDDISEAILSLKFAKCGDEK
jgi:transcriptional regulator with XRE-family HTH domain